jgi:flagellar basal-body rod protein FlgF
MQNQLYVALSAQVSLSKRLETIASNIANMNTPGYRADGTAFAAEVAKIGDAQVAYVSPASNYISRRSGPLVKTDNPLDVAVQGDGWFAIQTKNGVVYTRDGRMTMAETGELRTLTGNAVLDAGGAPIILDPAAGPPTIANDGMITQNRTQVGAIGLFSLADATSLNRAENSGVIPNKPAVPILDFTQNGVVQGSFEGSNINPIEEMTKLISVTRNFDGVGSEVARTESSLQDAIKTLAGS